MKITKIFEEQKKLDKKMEEVHKIKQKEVSNKKILALLVEVGEFANEIESFKYWKKNKKIDKCKMLEEYADGIHFFISFYVQLNIFEELKPEIKYKKIDDMFIELYKNISLLKNNITKKQLDESFKIFLGIGEMLKFNWKEVEEYYMKKNKINFERIKNNY